MFGKFSNRFLVLKQLEHRIESVSRLHTATGSEDPSTKIRKLDTIALVVFDVLVGCSVTYFLTATLPLVLPALSEMVEAFLTAILGILQWLRGTPAGLKLNEALNSLLCRFFSYHLHLWKYYLNVISPILSVLMTGVVYVGCLGFTVQVSLFKDLVAVATFHVYCLYIYATRLFDVQRRIIISLGRLFLGKKWNPLRNRVDSVQLSLPEMFLGSLGFTIAVFLLPTTLVYYAVFLALRLPIQLVEFVLRSAVGVINSLKLVTAVLKLLQSSLVADEYYFEPIYHTSCKKSKIELRFRSFCTRPIVEFPNVASSLKQTLKEISQGIVMQE